MQQGSASWEVGAASPSSLASAQDPGLSGGLTTSLHVHPSQAQALQVSRPGATDSQAPGGLNSWLFFPPEAATGGCRGGHCWSRAGRWSGRRGLGGCWELAAYSRVGHSSHSGCVARGRAGQVQADLREPPLTLVHSRAVRAGLEPARLCPLSTHLAPSAATCSCWTSPKGQPCHVPAGECPCCPVPASVPAVQCPLGSGHRCSGTRCGGDLRRTLSVCFRQGRTRWGGEWSRAGPVLSPSTQMEWVLPGQVPRRVPAPSR